MHDLAHLLLKEKTSPDSPFAPLGWRGGFPERLRVLFKLIFKTIGLVKTLIYLAVLVALVYLFVQYNPWAKEYVPGSVLEIGGYSASVSQCMVEKSQGEISDRVLRQIQDTSSIQGVSVQDMNTLYSHAKECSRK